MRSSSSLSFLSHDRNTKGNLDVGANYPFSAQYRIVNGVGGWYVFDASTGGWDEQRFEGAIACEKYAALTKEKAAEFIGIIKDRSL